MASQKKMQAYLDFLFISQFLKYVQNDMSIEEYREERKTHPYFRHDQKAVDEILEGNTVQNWLDLTQRKVDMFRMPYYVERVQELQPVMDKLSTLETEYSEKKKEVTDKANTAIRELIQTELDTRFTADIDFDFSRCEVRVHTSRSYFNGVSVSTSANSNEFCTIQNANAHLSISAYNDINPDNEQALSHLITYRLATDGQLLPKLVTMAKGHHRQWLDAGERFTDANKGIDKLIYDVVLKKSRELQELADEVLN